jgi:hypothetical protein
MVLGLLSRHDHPDSVFIVAIPISFSNFAYLNDDQTNRDQFLSRVKLIAFNNAPNGLVNNR